MTFKREMGSDHNATSNLFFLGNSLDNVVFVVVGWFVLFSVSVSGFGDIGNEKSTQWEDN